MSVYTAINQRCLLIPYISKMLHGMIIAKDETWGINASSFGLTDLSSTMYPGVPPQADKKDPSTDIAM